VEHSDTKRRASKMDFCERQSMGMSVPGGAAAGSLGTGAGYEYNAKRQVDKLENDYGNERVSPGESMRLKKDR
jgi:hypothetical protein